MKYKFYGVIEKEKNNFGVYFPDLNGCISVGETIEDVCKMGKEALSLHLYGMEENNEVIPQASSFNDLLKNLKENEFLQLFIVDTEYIKTLQESIIVNKTVTLPKYLIELGKGKKVNFSQLLKKALIEELGL